MAAEPLVILLAEDDEGHALLVKRNLARSGIANEIVHVKDGQAAIDYVKRQSGLPSTRGALLLILDINMPKLDGIEVLAWLRGDEEAKTIPVIMLTTTDDPREVNRCYELGCNVYVTKPVEYEAFVEAVRRLGLLLQIVQLPSSQPK